MRTSGIAALVLFANLAAVRPVAAQDLRLFGGGGATGSTYPTYPTVGGGVIANAGQPWVAVGAQTDLFIAPPDVAGR